MQPFLEKTNVYEARTEGYFHYRIPTMVVTGEGTVLAFAEGRRGSGGDWDENDIVLKRSVDEGKTWEPMRRIVSGNEAGATISNWVAISDPENKVIHGLYCVNYERCFYVRSTDDGISFGEPVDITYVFERYSGEYAWKAIAAGPGHGIKLDNGRLVVPVWLSLSLDESRHRPSVASVIYSDDNGQTWHAGDLLPDTVNNLNEATAVQLSDGSVYINVRNEGTPPRYRRMYSISADGARGWSVPAFDEQLEEPICFGSLIRLSGGSLAERSRILFVNPVNLDVPFRWKSNKQRKDLTVKMSCDECRTWPVRKLLEPGDAEYSDLAVLPDGTILCLYSRAFLTGGADPKFVTLARFNLEWLTDGADRLPADAGQ